MSRPKRIRKPIQYTYSSDEDNNQETVCKKKKNIDDDDDYFPSEEENIYSEEEFFSEEEFVCSKKEQIIHSEKQKKEKSLPKDKRKTNAKHKVNTVTREKTILKQLTKEFKNNNDINIQAFKKESLNHCKKTSKIEDQVNSLQDNGETIQQFSMLCNDFGQIDLAFFKKVLSIQLVETLETRLIDAYKLRMKETNSKKRTLYTGLWSKSNPMNYETKTSNDRSGKYVIDHILPIVAPIAKNILSIVDKNSYNFYSNLDPKVTTVNKCFFPCCAINFLEQSDDLHRVEKLHHDNDDAAHSVLFYFGKANAKLKLFYLKRDYDTQRGDILVFKGKDFLHSVGKLETPINPNNTLEEMRISLVLFAHKSLVTKPIYLLPKKEAIIKFDSEYPEEAQARKERTLTKNNKNK